MSEVHSRPAAARGRGSGRGGRGGGTAARGGGRAGARPAGVNGEDKPETESSLPTFEDEGEVGQLRQQYGSKVAVIKEMFTDWSEVDILFALRETDGDENLAVTRIAEGTISQWGEVSKTKKERSRPKAKPDTATTAAGDSAPGGAQRNARGGRNADSGRGRGRATERGGRGGARGRSTHATTNGTRAKESQPLSVPTEESTEWNTKPSEESPAWGEPSATENAPGTTTTVPNATATVARHTAVPEGTKTTWASMLRQSTTPKPAPKPKEAPAKVSEPAIEHLPPAEPTAPEPEGPAPAPVEESAAEPVKEPAPAPQAEPAPPAVPVVPAVPAVTPVVPEVALLPSKDQLTEKNLDTIADVSHPPQTDTAASEAADSWDPRGPAPSATATPLSASQQQHQARTAPKPAARTPVHHPRRMLDQLEPVRMPGNRDQVDRAAVQFGAFSLNGPIDDDVDGDREEPETRPQPPEDSPVAHPRTSLPPRSLHPFPKRSPPKSRRLLKFLQDLPPLHPPHLPQMLPPPRRFGRFGQPASQEHPSFPTSKPFEPFGQQPAIASATQNQFEGGFQGQGQAAQAPSQQQPGGPFSSAPSEFSSYYTADHQNRFNYYNQNFGQQQGAQGQQDALSSQPQRSFAGYNAPQTDNLTQYPQSGVQHGQSRFGAAAADSQVGAAPAAGQAASQAQNTPSTQAQTHGQQPHEYPYSAHPYYSSPYYSGYMGGYQGYNQGAYGGPYGKGGLGYQPSQYGITPQGPHGYSSPAGAFGQSALHRDTGVMGGLGDYGRAGSAQSGQQGLGGGFGGVHDTFGRGGSAYQSQGGQAFNAPGSQPGAGPTSGDDLKPFGDSKAGGGPSPSLGTAPRPGSAANNGPSQAGLPPPQSSQQSGLGGMGGYGYPSHMQGHGLHGTQSAAGGYGMSASGAQSHQTSYGAGYGAQGFAGNYYGNPPRGWGNNYH
ncbi:88df26e8-0932-4d7a-8046-40bca91bd687 [Thermothielavioides terrestris]|uniref:RNA polymerase II degradation factor 1 n=1 Tax=Thermothielavioides terrestris TaxID=2587410 RepID=A0A3S4B2S7_9PEZI|nr:88df26e8-0932-4d7a-8046-40bca91bd687 [Thermothielavioides terrestris]